jgi:hypothetical protein
LPSLQLFFISFLYDESYKSKLTINGGTITGATNGVYLVGNVAVVNGGKIVSNSTNKDEYAFVCHSNSSCTFNSGSEIYSENASAVYMNGPLTLTGAKIKNGSNVKFLCI